MAQITKAPIGSFCWVEHTSKDVSSARKFYGEVFGWSFEERPMPGGAPPYTTAKVGDRFIGGFTKMDVPSPFWLPYVAVDDAAAVAKRARSLGGTVKKEMMAGEGMGKFAIISDPAGAMFAVWQELKSMGTWLYAENGALCWNELVTTDVERSRPFYTELMGWRAEEVQGGYTVFKRGDAMVAGMTKGPSIAWSSYFQVPGADATVSKAQKLGAKTIVAATETAGVGRWALLQDPQGAAVGLLQPKR
jgi:predicted enzyme related to lactoylglutathione lyase